MSVKVHLRMSGMSITALMLHTFGFFFMVLFFFYVCVYPVEQVHPSLKAGLKLGNGTHRFPLRVQSIPFTPQFVVEHGPVYWPTIVTAKSAVTVLRIVVKCMLKD
jgi:hypothetical protein